MRTPFSSPNKAPPKGPYLMPHGGLRPTQPGSPNKTAKMMAAIKKLQDQNQITLTSGIVASSADIFQASQNAPTASTNLQLGITDATQEISEGTLFLLRHLAQNQALPTPSEPVPPMPIKGRIPTVRNPQWHAKGWVLKYQDVLTVDLPKVFDHEATRDHLEPFLANASSPSPSDLGIDQDLLQGHIKFVKERRPNFVAAPDSAYNHMKDISNRESEGDISSGVEKRGDEDENMDYNDGGGEPWQGIQNVDSGDGGDADEGEEVAQSRTEMGKHKGRYDCKCRWAATTLEKLLRAAKEAVEQRASTITFQGLSGYRSEKEISEIRANASTIDKVQWTPSFAMIDKDQAELNALEEVRRWVKAHGIPLDFEESVGEPDPPSLPRPAMDGLMKLIRPLQRVRSPANSFEWQTAVEKFNDGVRSLSVQHKMDEGTATKILSYFQENWFCDRWRMDQLVVVIINDVFPYFEMWPPTAPRPSKTLVGVMRSGHNLWQISHFELVVEDMGKQLWAIIRDSTAEKATSKSEAKSRSIAEKKFWEVGDLGEREYSEIGWPATGTVTRPRLTVHAPFPAPEVDNGPSRSNGTNRESPSPVVVQPKSKPHPQAGASPVGFNTCSAAREATSKAKGVKAAPSPAVFTIKQGQGLVNGVGRNICYLNAAFQALLHLPFIRNKLLETRVIRTTRSADFVKSLCELACQWEKAMEPFEVEWFLKHRLQDVVRGDNEPSTQEYLNDFDFPVNEQQCISEFFWNFFNKLRNDCTDVKEGQTCESQTLEIGVPVKLKDTKTLKELVAALFTTSYQPHPTVVHGTSCCSATTIQVHTTIINTPRYILIHLDRSEERRLGDTVSRGVKICRELELGEYTGGKFPHLKYKLASTIRHRAFDEHSGHYMTDVMVGNAWRRFDDDKVSSVEDPFRHSACRSKKVGGQTVWQDSPVMLVYQIQEQSKGSKTAGTGGIDTHTDTDQLRSGTAFEVKGASSASTAEPGATAAPSSETSLPHWLKGYNFEASSSLPRLLESFDLANANAIETFKRLIAAPSETQKGYATFVKAGDIPGVGNGLIIPPQSASRFKPGAWADNHIMSVWTELLARFAPPSVYCLDGPFYESLGTRRGSALQVEKFHNKALFSTMPSYRRILFFVPFTNHWAVGVIDTAQRQVILLDSRGKAFNLAHFHERIRSFLLGVYTRELQATPLFTVPGHPLYEELPLSNDVTSYVPQQSDGNNCGYIATRYMELAVLGLHPTAVNCGLLGDQWSSHEGDQLRMDVWIKLVNLAPSTSLASTASDTPAPCTRGTSLAGSADEVLGKNKRRRQQKLSLRGGSRQTRDCTPDVVQGTYVVFSTSSSMKLESPLN
ncbi:hypothetical protein QFC22_005375 [Naganishia vaughanmartiniae]|uniref:Uncharacterized protein n=1 Tax=Naganishia vaughanmartiniae TaxID=1424756 RepID=A0ACC2WVG4_9TREE|nr:hypothetical protein QFC22_005375 [Naganishia vaughanmartiniae]